MSFDSISLSPVWLYVLFVWSIFWKGMALWRAATCAQRNWFIAILVLNTVGILELTYLFLFCKKKLTLKELPIFKNLK